MGHLQGKRVLITGVLSDRSIAYGIAQAMFDAGAQLAFSYQSDRFKQRVEKFAAQWNTQAVFPCDVASDEQIQQLFIDLGQHWDHLDAVVHCIAFAPKDQLSGSYIDCVDREGFLTAHDISSYSFAALAKAALPLMQDTHGSLLTLSYLGAERAIPNYNVMGVAKASLEANVRYMAYSLGPRGIRVNAISAGPIRTLAASGIKGFKQSLEHSAEVAPLRKNVSLKEVGDTATFLCSDGASGITGEVIHVDAGYHIV